MIYLVLLLLAVTSASQAPGVGWAMAPSLPREIRTLYWELFQTSECWVRLVPETRDGKPAPLSLIFIATFPGKKLAKPPEVVRIQAQINPLTVVHEFPLKLRLQPGGVVDLTARLSDFQFVRNCSSSDDCSVTGVMSFVPWNLFRQIIQAVGIEGEILGLEVSLGNPDLDALRRFAQHLEGR